MLLHKRLKVEKNKNKPSTAYEKGQNFPILVWKFSQKESCLISTANLETSQKECVLYLNVFRFFLVKILRTLKITISWNLQKIKLYDLVWIAVEASEFTTFSL